MSPLPLLFVAVLVLLAAERALELVINRRNSRWLRERGAVWLREDGFELILAAQVLLFLGPVFELSLASWAGVKPWTWPLLGVLALAQALRYWCITTLGPRWSIRVVTLPGAPRITGGPYRFFAHPNYVVVLAEAIALPLAFGAYATLVVLVPLKLLALANRVRLEERALRKAEPADAAERADPARPSA